MINRIAVATLAFLLVTSAEAQSGQGEISGIVKDPSGAGIPKAPVTLVNQDSGVSRPAISDPFDHRLISRPTAIRQGSMLRPKPENSPKCRVWEAAARM